MRQVRSVLLVLLVLLLIRPGHAQEAVRVLVVPFEVYSQEPAPLLRDEIAAAIRQRLTREGAEAVTPEGVTGWADGASSAAEVLRQAGIRSGADHVVWGSLTLVGQQFSLDAKLLDIFGKQPQSVFFAQGERIENLPGTVKQLADGISLKVFQRQLVTRVTVQGNERIEADAILRVIQTTDGSVYDTRRLGEDLKAVFAMGYFEDIRIEASDEPGGRRVVFTVEEKPTVREVRFSGNQAIKDDTLQENLSIRTGAILNIFEVRKNIRRIEELYREKNYHNIQVDHAVHEVRTKQVDLEFTITEGDKLKVTKIVLEGNHSYPAGKLQGLMETSERGFFSWLTSSGEYNPEDLQQDALKLAAFYQNNGYIDARVGQPEVRFGTDGIEVIIKIDEGRRYTVGNVDIQGDLVLPRAELAGRLKIGDQEYFSREVVRNDVLVLTDLYSDEGYAYADVATLIDQDNQARTVNIVYDITKGRQVYFEKITISGNTKTRDKVIRRELRVYEQELYSGRRLKRGVRNLYRLEYFDDIKVDTPPGSAADKIHLNIEVTEKPTGAFTFGGGYSSTDRFFTVGSISQRNLFGRGQSLEFKAQLGGTNTRYSLRFVEPWLFDIPLSLSLELYDWDRDYNDYEKSSQGGGVRVGYPLFDFTRGYLGYSYERADVRDIDAGAAQSIKDLEGINITSAVDVAVHYDSRDRTFFTTRGSNHRVSVEYAGLGGDIGYTKTIGETGWYFPLVWSAVGFVHAKAGYVSESSGKLLPDYEKFYLGGINSLRGFDWRDISPRDASGDEIGGVKFVQFNAEIEFPLFEAAGLAGVVFFDTGDVYDTGEDIDVGDLRESVGAGFRWLSPVGPIRLEYGHILDRRDDEDSDGRWEFTMGSAF